MLSAKSDLFLTSGTEYNVSIKKEKKQKSDIIVCNTDKAQFIRNNDILMNEEKKTLGIITIVHTWDCLNFNNYSFNN